MTGPAASAVSWVESSPALETPAWGDRLQQGSREWEGSGWRSPLPHFNKDPKGAAAHPTTDPHSIQRWSNSAVR